MWKTDEEWLLDEEGRLKKRGLKIGDRKIILKGRYSIMTMIFLASFLIGLFSGMVMIVLMGGL